MFVIKTFLVGNVEVKLLLMGDVYLVPYKIFCETLSLRSRALGVNGWKPVNQATSEMLKELRDVKLAKPTTVKLLLFTLQDVVDLHSDCKQVRMLAQQHFGAAINVHHHEEEDRSDTPPPPRKRQRDIQDFEDSVTRVITSKYRIDYIAEHCEEWKKEVHREEWVSAHCAEWKAEYESAHRVDWEAKIKAEYHNKIESLFSK